MGEPRQAAERLVDVSKSDSDTVRLMSGIIAALRRAGSAVGDDVDRDLAAPGIDVADQVLPRLLDALDADDPTVLILDDFHLLRGASAHEAVATLLADMPESLRVIISTRADPVMPLAGSGRRVRWPRSGPISCGSMSARPTGS